MTAAATSTMRACDPDWDARRASMTGFGTGWLDYDNDGRLDLFVTNGAVNIIEGQRGQPFPYRQQSQLFHNEGNGRFRDVSPDGGPFFDQLLVGRGVAFGDLDNDGDVDIVVTTNNGPAVVLLNQTCAPGRQPASSDRHWIEVDLRSADGKRAVTGARVGIERSGQPTLWRRARTDGSYLSASDGRVHAGLGALPHIDRVVVQWPDGATRVVRSTSNPTASSPCGRAQAVPWRISHESTCSRRDDTADDDGSACADAAGRRHAGRARARRSRGDGGVALRRGGRNLW